MGTSLRAMGLASINRDNPTCSGGRGKRELMSWSPVVERFCQDEIKRRHKKPGNSPGSAYDTSLEEQKGRTERASVSVSLAFVRVIEGLVFASLTADKTLGRRQFEYVRVGLSVLRPGSH